MNNANATNNIDAEFFQCTHCPCKFLTKADLETHIAFFGDKPHEEYWQSVHRRADYGSGDYY